MPFLNPHKFRRLISRQGEPCLWEKAFRATDYNPKTGEENHAAALQTSHGWVYVPQPASDERRIVIDEKSLTMVDEGMGILRVGSARAWTLPKDLPLARPDRITLTNWTEMARETLQVTPGALTSTLTRSHVIDVQYVMAGQNTFYVKGVDWEYSASDRAIRWLTGGNRPTGTAPGGTMVAVEYTYRPTFYYLGQQHTSGRPSRYGEPTPQNGLLTILHPDAGS